MHRGTPRVAASSSSVSLGRSSGCSNVPSAVAGPDLALRAQEHGRKLAQQTIKSVHQGQWGNRAPLLELTRLMQISHPHDDEVVELPRSRDPPEQAQLACVDSTGAPVIDSPIPTVKTADTPQAAVIAASPPERAPEHGAVQDFSSDDSRRWCWARKSTEPFHLQLDVEHVAPTARVFRWQPSDNGRSWNVSHHEDVPTLPTASPAEDHAASQLPMPPPSKAQPPGSGASHTRGSMCAHVHMTQEHVHVPAAGSALEPGWDARTKTDAYFPEAVWDQPFKPPYVHVVDTAAGARRAMALLRGLVEKDAAAARAHALVNDYGRKYWSRRIFACDTEATDIDVASECAAGHGRVTCWTAYCGPDVNFARDDLTVRPGTIPECVLYVDTYLSGDDDLPAVLEIWDAMRPFLESDDYPKVWHNYGFDKHILQRRGLGIPEPQLRQHGKDPEQLSLSLGGFAGDTMHMARLHDAARKGTKTYSLASLTSDKTVMCAPDRSVLTRSKISLKELFARPKISKSGKPSASLKELPPIHELQTTEDERMRWKWVDYSAFDSKATWDLYHSLREKLQSTTCTIDEALRHGMCGSLPEYSQWDLYLDVLWPFGEALTVMEQEGFYVDKEHLAEQDLKAQADLHDAGVRFRTWLRKYAAVIGQGNEEQGWHPDDIPGLVNLSSSAQIQTLLFGGFSASKDVLKKPTKAEAEAGMKEHMVKPTVESARLFTVENPKYGEPGERKQMPFKLTCVFGTQGTAIARESVTMVTAAQGLPMTSAAALRVLCGKPGAAKKLLKELDTSNVHAAGAEAAEALGDVASSIAEDGGNGSSAEEASDSEARVMTKTERAAYQAEKGLGHLYTAFRDHKDGLEACAAVEALIEISAIETLRSAFLLPLQGDAVSAEDGRVHCSMNLNTETGRLSCRRPNLQNQPALEKDRYFIRKAFRAPAGRTLVVADYGQLELRILAHMTGCVSMIEAFDSGGDFHSRTAAGMFPEIQKEIAAGHVALDHMDPNFKEGMVLVKDKYSSERRKAKILNFSLAYGKTEYGLSKDFNVTLAEAKGIVERWYKSRPEVAQWQTMVREQAKKDVGLHRVQTMLGRHRILPGYGKGKTAREEARASRAAINTPIQGSAADVVAAAMVRIHHDPMFRKLGWRMLLQVHDEVIIEGPEESSAEAQARLVECMQRPFIKDRAKLHQLITQAQAGEPPVAAEWNECYHCGMQLELTVDSKVAATWYEAK